MTSYQGNGSNVAATTVTTANKLASAVGGTETNTLTKIAASTTGWIIIRSQGISTAQSGAGSEPTITDSNNFGWMQDDSTFDGKTFAAGSWTPTITLNMDSATITADIHCLILKRPSGGGAYVVIGDIALTGQSITTTKTTFSLAATSENSAAFAAGDRLCKVWVVNITANGSGLTQDIQCYMSTSASTGVASDTQIVSPGYSPTGTTARKSAGVRLRLAVQRTQSLGVRLRLMVRNTQSLGVRFRLGYGHTVSLPVRLRLMVQNTRSAGVRLRLAVQKTVSVGVRLRLVTGIVSGGFCLYANGTGTANFDDFRVTAYPDPSLALEPVGRLGSSFVSWNAILPSAATTLGMYTSLRGDGTDWTDVSAQSGGAIPGLYGQPDPTIDGFGTITSANYTITNQTGGAVPTVTYDIAHSRVSLTGGTNGLYLYASLARADIDALTILDTADSGGLVWRFVDQNNYYVLVVADSLASVGTPQRATLYSVVGNVTTQIAQATIPFVRGTWHVARVSMLKGVITATWDGAALFSYTDPSPLGAGLVGLYNNGGVTGSRYYQLWIQPQGDLLLNTYVYTKEAPATTDATKTPQLLDLTVAAFNPNIGPGALIPSADYRHQFTDKVADDLVKQSRDYSWFIDQNFQFYFRKRTAVPAPWVLYSSSIAPAVDLEADSNLQVTIANDLYRNRQVLTNVINSGLFSDTFIGDNNRTSFTLRYPIAPGTIPTITLNGTAQSAALKGKSGAQWYYAPGDPVIAQDAGGVKLISTDTLAVNNYIGTFLDTITVDNVATQQALALVAGGTGIVEAVEDVSSRNMSYAAGLVYAGQLLARYCINNARTIQFANYRNGLSVGQILPVFVVEENLWNAQMLITAIDPITIMTQPGNTILYKYLVTASELPPIGSWSKLFGAGLLLS